MIITAEEIQKREKLEKATNNFKSILNDGTNLRYFEEDNIFYFKCDSIDLPIFFKTCLGKEISFQIISIGSRIIKGRRDMETYTTSYKPSRPVENISSTRTYKLNNTEVLGTEEYTLKRLIEKLGTNIYNLPYFETINFADSNNEELLELLSSDDMNNKKLWSERMKNESKENNSITM